MRRNLRLDWRALALLGALLSIIVEWPGLFVYAMPTIFQPVINNDGQQQQQQQQLQQQQQQQLHPQSLAAVTAIKHFTYSSKITEETAAASKTNQQQEFPIYNISYNNNSDSAYNNNNNIRQENNVTNSEQSNKNNSSDLSKTKTTTMTSTTTDSNISNTSNNNNINVSNNNDRSTTMATSPHNQLHNLERNTVVNLISNKRKRKKIDGKEYLDEDAAAATAEEGIFPLNSISNNKYINNNNQFLSHIESNTRTFVDETTTTTTQTATAINANNNDEHSTVYAKSINSGNHNNNNISVKNTTPSPPIIPQKPTISRFSSSSSSSTQYAEIDAAEDVDDYLEIEPTATLQSPLSTSGDSDSHADDNHTFSHPSFAYSSSHHIAILSRTERSIRSIGNYHHGGGIVRRSSDIVGLKTKRLNNSRNINKNIQYNSNLDRNERSTISHLSGPARKIQLYIKSRFLQLLPDGTVNGTQDEQSEYTILQRTTVKTGRIKIRSIATCLYLCMDACGAAYGSKDFTDDCVFNEKMEQTNYNSYSSTFNSNARHTNYLALNRHGELRRLQIPSTRSLGRLSMYTNAITEPVLDERVEQLIAKNFGENRIKHGIRQLCDTGKPLIELIDSKHFRAQPKCGNPNSSNSSSNSNSKKNNSNSIGSSNSSSSYNSNGQLLINVPAANDKSRNSSSNNISVLDTNNSSNSSSYSSNNSSSLNSDSQTDNGHNSSNISNSNSTRTVNRHHQQQHHSGGMKKKKKRRKCRPNENEEENNCQRSPQALRKKGNNNNNNNNKKKCKEQQQQANTKEGSSMPAVACSLKRGGAGGGGPKRNGGGGGNKKPRGGNRNEGGGGFGTNNRRGKKLNTNGGRQGTVSIGGGVGAGAINRKLGKTLGGGNNKQQKKHNKKHNSQQFTTATTKARTTTDSTTTSSRTSLKPTMTTLLAIESTSVVPSETTEIYDGIADFRAESTSIRVERDREQRNVRFTSSMEDSSSAEDSSSEAQMVGAADDDLDEDSNAEDADTDDEYNDANDDEIQPPVPSSSHGSIQLNGRSDDLLDYDQFDFIPIGLWEFVALLWIYLWCLQIWI